MRTLTWALVISMVIALSPLGCVLPAKSSEAGSYVILTNIPEGDPYYAAVSSLKNYRSASILRFQHNVNETLQSLKTLTPDYVAVAVKPQTINVDFAAQTYLALSQLDNDSFIDCPVGFITGATAEDTLLLVSNTIKAENDTRPTKYTALTNSNTTFGGIGGAYQRAQVYSKLFAEAGWATSLVDVYHKPPDLNQRISGSAIMTIDMHGYATYIENLTSTEVKNGPQQYLYPTVAIASPCYSACTSNFVEECYCINETIDPNNSFALSFIKKGSVGYIGHLRMYGDNWYVLEPAFHGMVLLGLPQGESLRQALDLGLLRHPNVTEYSTQMLGYVLYGDPQFTPITQPIATPIVTANSVTVQDGINLKFSINRNISYPTTMNGTWLWNATQWAHLSGTTQRIAFRYSVPTNRTVTGLEGSSTLSFSDPANQILNIIFSQTTAPRIDYSNKGTFYWIEMNIGFKSQPTQLVNGTTINISLATVTTPVIPEFPPNTVVMLLMASLLAGTLFLNKKLAKRTRQVSEPPQGEASHAVKCCRRKISANNYPKVSKEAPTAAATWSIPTVSMFNPAATPTVYSRS